MKEIKDYLHLYLGCKVWDEYDNDIKILYSVTCDNVVYLLKNTQHKRTLIEIKPILRSLSDMTQEEDKECHNIMFGEYAEKVKKQNIIHYEAEKIRYLLLKHFDLFNLIESGLAIDQKTLKPWKM